MPTLIEPMPQALQNELGLSNGHGTNGHKPEPSDSGIVIAVVTDLTLDGTFGREWLVVTKERLRVYPTDPRYSSPRLDIPLVDLKAPRVDTLIGGAALVGRIDDRMTEIVRFTNAKQRKFSRVSKYLDDVAKYHAAVAKAEEGITEPELGEDTEEEKRCPKCNLLLPDGTRVCPACMSKGRVMLRLGAYLRPYAKQSIFLTCLILLSTCVALISPLLNRPLFDIVLIPSHNVRPLNLRLVWLGWIVLGMIAAQITTQVINIIQGRTAVWLTHSLAHDLRTQLFRHLQVLSLRYFDKRQIGTVLTRVTQDTHELESVLTVAAQFFISHILTIIGIGIVLVFLNPILFLLVMIPMPFVAMFSHVIFRRIGTVWNRWWHKRAQMNAMLNDSLTGIRVVKAFAQENREIERFDPRSHALATAGMAAERAWMSVVPILQFLMGSGALIVTYFGGRMLLSGNMTIGTLMTFTGYLGMFYGPLQFLSRMGEWLGRSLAAAERIFDILDSEPNVPDAKDAVPVPTINGRVQFEDVSFGYDAHKPVLKNVSIDVAQGEMIGLVGHSGAGKSTSINLLCRFYDVNEGRILVDGIDIRKIRQQDLRSQIGVVLQDTFLFNGTISDNISFAKPDATRLEIMAAAKAANAHDFIVHKTDGYDTVVGERGQSLSGGERQRISIARAILHNPRILILDEATSSVDTDTEKQIQDAIARLIKGRTTFAIAHRLSTLRNADRLLVLKDGKVEEIGTHDELIEKKGEFYRLVEMQQEMSRIKAVAR